MDRWPEDALEAVSRCPVCGSDARALLHPTVTDDAFRCAPGEWQLWRCDHCGSAYLDPRPNEASIGLAYQSYYTHAAREVSRGGRLKQLVLAAAYGYLNGRYGLALKPASRLGGWLSRLLLPFRGFLDGKLRHLPRPHAGALLLDVGCGHGDFLGYACQAGWLAHGLDFDPRAVAAARERGVEVHLGGLEVLTGVQERYDYITLSHVIEHVFRPKETLQQVWGLLKPGGVVWIETPNIDALGHRRFGRYWRGLEAPRHLTIFSCLALERSLIASGFEDVRVRYRGATVPLMYAESEALRANLPLGAVAIWRQRFWPCLVDGLIEEFRPTKREFITVTARRPSNDE